MKISDLIDKLTKLKETRGDNEIEFKVGHYFSRYGETMQPSWKIDDEFWEGTFTNDCHTTINFNLHSQTIDGVTKNPNIIWKKDKYGSFEY